MIFKNYNYEQKFLIFFTPDDLGEERTNVIVTKEDIKTFICDGATLSCPNMLGMITTVSSSPTQGVTGGIRLNVLNKKALFMGVDPMATEKDVEVQNFTILSPQSQCLKLLMSKQKEWSLGGKKGDLGAASKCQIEPVRWERFSDRILKNGEKVLTKKCILRCAVDMSMEITISNNGQDVGGLAPIITKLMKKMRITPENPWAFDIFKGAGKLAVSAIGVELAIVVTAACPPAGIALFGASAVTAGDGAEDLLTGALSAGLDKKTDAGKFILKESFAEYNIKLSDKVVENINKGAAFVASVSKSAIGYSALTRDIYTAAKSEYFDTVSKMSRKEREELIGGKKVGGTDVDLRILKGEYAKFKKNNPGADMSFDEFLNSQGKDLGKSAIGETTKGMTNNLLDKTTFETNLSWSNEKVFFTDNSQ